MSPQEEEEQGESTFVALASKYLNPKKLLIDLDPDESLADMLGIDLNRKGCDSAKAGGIALTREKGCWNQN